MKSVTSSDFNVRMLHTFRCGIGEPLIPLVSFLLKLEQLMYPFGKPGA
jgi:hypothetical protein